MAAPRKAPPENAFSNKASVPTSANDSLLETALGLTKEGENFYVVVLKYSAATGEAKVVEKQNVGVLAMGANERFKQAVVKQQILKRY